MSSYSFAGNLIVTDAEIVKFVNKLECEFPVNKWKLCGREVWPIIKMQLCVLLIKDSSNTHYAEKKIISHLSKFKKIVKYATSLFTFSRTVPKSDILIYHHNFVRNIKFKDNTYFDCNLDPFTVCLENSYSVLHLDFVCNGKKIKNTFRKTNFVNREINTAILKGYLKYLLASKNVTLDQYADFLLRIPKEVRYQFELKNILKIMYKYDSLTKFYKRILKESGAYFVIARCGYVFDTISLFTACDDLKVKSMEVQHGLAAGSNHSWYTKWENLPENKYQSLPNIYWVWSNSDYETMKKWCGDKHTIIQGGKPFFQVINELKKYIEIPSISHNDSKKTIIVSLQPGVSYPSWLISYILKKRCVYNWIIRPHPNLDHFQENVIRYLSKFNNIYISSKNSVLEFELSISDVHITNHSSVVLDAISFGVPSIIINKNYEEMFSEELRKGYALIASDEVELERSLTHYFEVRKTLFSNLAKPHFDIHCFGNYIKKML